MSDKQVRHYIYEHFVKTGQAPTLPHCAQAFACPITDVRTAYQRLANGRPLVLQSSGEILMAEPFSAVPTAFIVEIGSHAWWGNCIWDALGILAIITASSRFSTISAFPAILKSNAHRTDPETGERNQLMKRLERPRHLCWLVGFIILLTACTSPPVQSTRALPSPSPSQAARQLRPNASIPTSCPVTPVNVGGPLGTDTPLSPWLQAQPTSSGIVAYLAYSGVSPSGTYRLPHTNGFFPEEGLYTKTFWTIDNPHASSTFLIDGTRLSDVNKTFHDTGNAISGPGLPTGRNTHMYTSYLQAPSVGCWRLQVTSGQARGTITMWFVD